MSSIATAQAGPRRRHGEATAPQDKRRPPERQQTAILSKDPAPVREGVMLAGFSNAPVNNDTLNKRLLVQANNVERWQQNMIKHAIQSLSQLHIVVEGHQGDSFKTPRFRS